MKQQKEQTFADLPLPSTTDLERQLLADMVASPDMLGDVIPMLHRSFFTSEARRSIWDVIVDHYNRGLGLDVFTISSLTGEAYMREVLPFMGDAGGTITCTQHASLLRSAATKRRAYQAAAAFITETLRPENTEADILAKLADFAAQVEGPVPMKSDVPLSSVLRDVRGELEENEQRKARGENLRISTGFRYLDGAINGGFKGGQLVILAARPSVGKTAVMLQMAKNAATSRVPVEVFSLEMTNAELGERLLFSTGMVMPYQIAQADVQWAQYKQAEQQLEPLPLYINDFSRSLDDIIARMTQAVKQGRCGIAFIDYLGLIQETLNTGNVKLYQIISKITGTLKAVAKRLDIPIVVLCQINRDMVKEKRSPMLQDLRDSGSIEQDADIVIMLEPRQEEKIFAWLRKNRSGKKDLAFTLKHNSSYSTFEEEAPYAPVNQPNIKDLLNSQDEDDDEENEDETIPF